MKHASGVSVSSTGQSISRCTGVAGHDRGDREHEERGEEADDRARGDLLDRDEAIGSGASTRSSISRVYPNSCTIGSATDWMPWKMIASATTPATSSVENVRSRRRPAPPTPWPIFGNTYVNTNTSRNGWSSVRGMNSREVLASDGEVAGEQRAERDDGRGPWPRAGTRSADDSSVRRHGGRVIRGGPSR